MVNEQSQYDIEYVSGEFGETYTILINTEAGNPADISWADAAVMTVAKPDGIVLFSVAVNVASPNVTWAMLEAQTTAGTSYTGKIDVQVRITASTTRKKLTKIFKGFIYKNQVTDP